VIRKCVKIPVEILEKIYQITDIQYVSIYFDQENSEKILTVLETYIKKTRRIFYEILKNRYNDELYGKENFSEKTQNLTALKYRLGKGNNIRVYCKEYIDDQTILITGKSKLHKKVVMISVYDKKSNKIDKKLKNHLETIGGYQYEFEE